MERDEAEQLVSFLRSAPSWGQNINDEQAAFYANAISTIDATIASKAIIDGIGEWKFAPSLAQIYERVKQEKVKAKFIEAAGHTIELPPREPIPQWVWVWNWARTIRDPHDTRTFPQQATGMAEMTPDDYHVLEREWIEAGSPQPSRMMALRVIQDVPSSIEELLSGP